MCKRKLFRAALAILLFLTTLPVKAAGEKPLMTLDEFFNWVEVHSVKISPDGHAVVVETVRPDWEGNRFRRDLWLYRDNGAGSGGLIQLTQSGHDRTPEWSPDGRWIAFLTDRKPPHPETKRSDETEEKDVLQVYVISINGGEAFPVTHGEEEVHAFAWSSDSRLIYFATRQPWTKKQLEDYKKEWNDVIQYRESERGDVMTSVDVVSVMARNASPAPDDAPEAEARALASTPFRVKEIEASPDGRWLAFATDSHSQRQESMEPYGIYLMALPEGQVRLLSHTQAIYEGLRWAPDSSQIFFRVEQGSVEGPYQDVQQRVYSVEVAGGIHGRWGARFPGTITAYAVTPSGGLLAAGGTGTQVQPYTQENLGAEFVKRPGWPGTYERLSAAAHSARAAFVYSSLQHPTEVYLAESAEHLDQARPITAFNRLFTERALPQGKPYRWTAEDGTPIEGMLIYPPGKLEAKNLRMFTFIHGGPDEADGDLFEADWYKWGILAASNNWLVFEPNYRGSLGYGDRFALQIIHPIVSRPGKDILEGIDALVKDGIADPEHLTVGGYSYGGYLTNWLITQTTRFKAAVSGAGAVEHAANWGNDDTTFDDAYFLGGLPWEAEKNYNAEAAIWQFGKVRTPTHVVAGSEDIRVYVGEAYLLERALHTLGVPSSLLVFPGEGHELDKNPWHSKIKVREELKWLEKYGGK